MGTRGFKIFTGTVSMTKPTHTHVLVCNTRCLSGATRRVSLTTVPSQPDELFPYKPS